MTCAVSAAAPVQACANGTVTYLGNCSTSSVTPDQLYYARTESAVRADLTFMMFDLCDLQDLHTMELVLTSYATEQRSALEHTFNQCMNAVLVTWSDRSVFFNGPGVRQNTVRVTFQRYLCVAQSAASSKNSQLALETAVPIGSVLLIAAVSALAAYTGMHACQHAEAMALQTPCVTFASQFCSLARKGPRPFKCPNAPLLGLSIVWCHSFRFRSFSPCSNF